ncbi:hypothetical protein DICVIV_04163 [Dictyocaulus viviparus]|uniref:Uncharacterized protein n=1 Tax=Dictyocaulus viviparus TaxID=29172 RepID=A0A0D8Y560_DICVI|nr:hypothetical protein DICVIV_04163 [Dictyocaulus viviparus]
MSLPFVGEQTISFGRHCIKHVENKIGGSQFVEACDKALSIILERINASVRRTPQTFTSILIANISCTLEEDTFRNSIPSLKNYVQFIFTEDLSQIFGLFTYHLLQNAYLNSSLDRQVILNTSTYLSNFSTSCKSNTNFGSLIKLRQFLLFYMSL